MTREDIDFFRYANRYYQGVGVRHLTDEQLTAFAAKGQTSDAAATIHDLVDDASKIS